MTAQEKTMIEYLSRIDAVLELYQENECDFEWFFKRTRQLLDECKKDGYIL